MGTNCHQLKLKAADGKMRLTDVADMEQLFRLIQSIPSPKAEPFKRWMAQVAAERLDQMQDPELSIEQAVEDYRRLGYSESWINQRLKSIEVRKLLTDEWKRGGVQGQQYASLTDIITAAWSGRTTKQYKHLKGLHKENLRDNMTNVELSGSWDCPAIRSRTLQRNVSSQYYHRLLQSQNKDAVRGEMKQLTAPLQDKLEYLKNPVVALFW